MTHDTLRTLVRDDATGTEPPFTMSADTVVLGGRRRLRRRRVTTGLTSLAAAAVVAAAVVVPSLTGGGAATHARLDPATQAALDHYDAQLMPALVNETVRHAIGDTAPPFTRTRVKAQDSQGQALPEKYLDKASSWVGFYQWGSEHRLRVALLHSRSEAEGDPQRYCRDDLAQGYDLTCTAVRDDQDHPVITSEMALRLDTTFRSPDPDDQTWMAVDDLGSVAPGQRWFQRTVEVRRGGVYVTSVSESVKAPTLAAARQEWYLTPAVLKDVASAPALTFPAPPKDANGCDWVLPRDDVTVSCTHR